MENDSKLLLAKANDIVRLRDLRCIPKFLGFLTPFEAAIIESEIKAPNTFFFGGYPTAERRVFAALPDYVLDPLAEFPISAVKFEYRKIDVLSHRDFLGAFVGAGVTRDSIGDICMGEGFALAFLLNDVAEYLSEQVTKVGRCGVTSKILPMDCLNDFLPHPKTTSLNFTVSSLRLDAVLSGLTGCSRSKAENFIKEGFVFVNSFQISKVTKLIQNGDFITLRGTGKFQIIDCNGISKKGRIFILAEKYI